MLYLYIHKSHIQINPIYMTAILDNTGVHISPNDFAKMGKIVKGVLNDFKIEYKIMRNITQKAEAFYCENKMLHLPRRGAFDLLKANKLLKIKNKIAEPDKIPTLKYTGKLKHNQKVVINHMVSKYFSKDKITKGSAVASLVMKAGRGKTFVAMGFIHVFKTKTLIVVPTKNLLMQWMQVLAKFFPNAKIGTYSGSKKLDGDIVVAIVDSLIGIKIQQSYLNKFGLTIFDEVHTYCSPESRKIFWRTQTQVVIGLTATPNRPDRFDLVFRKQIGPVVEAHLIKGYKKDDVEFKGKVRVINYSGPPKYTRAMRNMTTGTVSSPAMINQFVQDPYRNQMIVTEIIRLYKMDLDVICFSDRLAHLDTVQDMLMANGIDKSALLVGGAKLDHLERVQTEAKIIMATYQAADTGLSIDRLTAMVVSTPRKSLFEQKIGRILRIGGDNSIVRHVVDIIDIKTSLKNQYYGRSKVYKAEGFDIEKIDVDWSDYEMYGLESEDSEKSDKSDESNNSTSDPD